MAITLSKITPEQHVAAVEWITDAFPHQEREASQLTPQQAYRVVCREYPGKWTAFLADAQQQTPQPCVWCATPTLRWDWGNPDCGCF